MNVSQMVYIDAYHGKFLTYTEIDEDTISLEINIEGLGTSFIASHNFFTASRTKTSEKDMVPFLVQAMKLTSNHWTRLWNTWPT